MFVPLQVQTEKTSTFAHIIIPNSHNSKKNMFGVTVKLMDTTLSKVKVISNYTLYHEFLVAVTLTRTLVKTFALIL